MGIELTQINYIHSAIHLDERKYGRIDTVSCLFRLDNYLFMKNASNSSSRRGGWLSQSSNKPRYQVRSLPSVSLAANPLPKYPKRFEVVYLKSKSSQRGDLIVSKNWIRDPGHIIGSPSTVPCLNHDRQGDVQAVRGRNFRRCRAKSLTASSLGSKEEISSSDIFRTTCIT